MRVLARHKMRSWVARLAQVESPGRSMHVRPATCACPVRVGLAITIYIRCIYGLFGRNITKYTVTYGVYTRFWPTLHVGHSAGEVHEDAEQSLLVSHVLCVHD